jgi:hypothetical protein
MCVSSAAIAQSIEKKVDHFNKIIASPKINLVLVEGTSESVRINYANVDPSNIKVTVKNHTLRIFLEGSRYGDKLKRVQHDGEVRKEKVYRDAVVTAYVSYDKLRKLVVRGEQNVDVQGKVANKKFKLSAYGECDINLAFVEVGWFKAAMYGQNTLKINEGAVEIQKYKLFGENKIDAQAIQSDESYATTYGESRLKIYAKENLKLVTFGESDVWVKGSPEIDKITFGEVSVKR